MAPLTVTWIELAGYLDSLIGKEKGRQLVMAKALKYLLFRTFVRSLKPDERLLMRRLEEELKGRGGGQKGR